MDIEEQNGDYVSVTAPAAIGELGGITEDSGEVLELSEAVIGAVTDIGALGGIQGTMETSVEKDEGLNEPAAEIAEVAIESIRIRLGINGASVFPSMESFSDKTTRVATTRIAAEGIGDMIQAAWEAIKRAFKAMWAKIIALYKRIFSGPVDVLTGAETLKKRVSELQGEPKGDGKIKVQPFWALSIKEHLSCDSVSSIIDTQLHLTTQLPELNKYITEGVNAIEEVMKNKTGTIEEATNILAKASDLINQELIHKVLKLNSGKSGIWRSAPLYNGDVLELTHIELFSEYPSIGMITMGNLKYNEPAKDEEIPVLKLQEMNILSEKILVLAKATEATHGLMAQIADAHKKLDAAIDTAINAVNSSSIENKIDSVLKTKLSLARTMLTDLAHKATFLYSQIPALSVKTCHTAIQFVEASVRLYSVKK